MSGIEAAVHATRSAFESENVEAVLLVDASERSPSSESSMALRSRFVTRMTRLLADPLTNYGTGGTSYLPKGLPLDTSRDLARDQGNAP